MILKLLKGKQALLSTSIFILLVVLGNIKLNAQGNSIRSGVTFNWADTQSNEDDPATISTIIIDGFEYTTFVVPSTYELTNLGPGGHDENNIWRNGSRIVDASSEPNWVSEAILAYQSLNLNHYFQADDNGDDFCDNPSAVATTNAQVQTISYNPGIPSNPNGILAVTERAGNNCLYVEMHGIPAGGGAEQLLGTTFIREGDRLGTALPPAPPNTPTSDYWSSGRVSHNGSTIGIALFQLSSIAPIGSIITSIRYMGATEDHGDGKFFLLQTYAVDDTFDTGFQEIFNGDVSTNDNVPAGSTYTESASPANGTLSVNTDGTFTYTPNPGFSGTDTFEIQVCLPAPNQSVCEVSTVSVSVKSSVSINDASATEGNNLVYNISTNQPINQDVSFDITYANNSTTSSDYSGPATVTLPANSNSVSFNVLANDDSLIEATEEFTVTITDPNNIVTITDNEGTGEIIDNDGGASSGLRFDFTNLDVDEDNNSITFNVILEGDFQDPFTVDYSTANIPNQARTPQDYIATNGTLNFNGNNNESYPITINIICLLYTSPSPRDQRGSRMPSSA